jgi:hypothetical protein
MIDTSAIESDRTEGGRPMGFLNLSELREAIALVFTSWEAFPGSAAKFKIVGVKDEPNDRYVLEHVDFDGERYNTRLLANLEIRDGKIWILTDNTEEGIATELFASGVPKQQIVLGFYSKALRETGDFAVA